ncbi:MAG: hypothetical protein AAF548_10320 [Actinomycetota bacterium]
MSLISTADAVVHPWDAEDQLWQESVAAWFWDGESRAGGFFRFGIHPTHGVGRHNLFAFFADGDRFRRVRSGVAIAPNPTEPLRVGSTWAGVDRDGRLQFSWAEPECEADFTMVEHFYPEHGFAGGGDDALEGLIYGGHLESSGRITGRLRVGSIEREIDALVHRDRSWGPRDMSMVLTNRMMSGTFGAELSFALNTIVLQNGMVARVGFLARDGVIEDVEDYVILPSIHLDGYSVEAGDAYVRTKEGEQLHISCRTVEGFLNPHDEYLCSEHISIARCGDRVGFCDNELTNNPRLGHAMPPHPLYVTDGDGLSSPPARPYRDWIGAHR